MAAEISQDMYLSRSRLLQQMYPDRGDWAMFRHRCINDHFFADRFAKLVDA